MHRRSRGVNLATRAQVQDRYAPVMADGDVAKVPLIPRVPGEATQDLDTPELADLAVLPNCARGALDECRLRPQV